VIRTCPDQTPCLGDEPLDNFSSEGDDTIDYISMFFAGDHPKLFKPWTALECGVTFISFISQLDADLQAQAIAETCIATDHNPDIQLFLNAPQTCCVPCPDGSQTCYTVPGGIFPAINQATADALAHEVACALVARNKVCIGNVPKCTCVGSAYSATLTATMDVNWSLNGGSLPPGLVFSGGSGRTATITGIPTTSGQYTFQIRGDTFAGPFNLKTLTITVIEIATTSLPPYTVGTPYSFQLVATGGSGNYSWRISSGSLPPGLTMSITGLISGVPL
jgi:hypothetical protein